MPELPNKELLRPDEVAAFFGVTKSTIYRWCDIDILHAVKIRGTVRITRGSIEAHVKEIKYKLS